MQRFLYPAFLALLMTTTPHGAATTPSDSRWVGTLQVSAGAMERRETVLSFPLPANAGSQILLVRKVGSSAVQMVQQDSSGQGWILSPPLAAGETRTYDIVPGAVPPAEPLVTAERTGRKIRLRAGNSDVLEYQAEPGDLPRPDIKETYRRGGYLHPLTSPAGTVITDDYPANHIHHHGIWMPWTKTKFEGREPDFWNMGAGTGRVEFERINSTWSGPVHAGFQVRHKFVDLLAPGGRTALNETWTVRVYPGPAGPDPVWMIDLESVQTCATDQPLILPEYLYGGLGFRGHGDWNGAANTYWLTSNGETNRVKGHATRANWCYIGGDTTGRHAGLAILCHPSNFRAPQPMRIHPTEPFFCFAPQQLGPMSIEPGTSYVSKYRFIVMDGEPSRERIDALWRDYANPVVTKVTWQD